MSSLTRNASGTTWHQPVLDIDVPHALVPSSTPGHSHLYLDVDMDWATYQKLLDALADAGIVQARWVAVSKEVGSSLVRLPSIRKDPDDERDLGY